MFLILGFSSCQDISEEKSELDQKIDDSVEAIIQSIPEITFPDRSINLIEYSGHKPDMAGSYNFQPLLNKAIDELSKQGGGTIYFPHTLGPKAWVKETDIYRMDGPINLKSNIRLMLASGTKIKFTFNPKNYLNNGKGVITRWEGVSIKSFSPLVRAFNVENIAIVAETLKGTAPVIDGDGEKWQHWYRQDLAEDHKLVLHRLCDTDVKLADREFTDIKKDFYRPFLMEFYLSKNILIDGVKLTNTPFWTVHPVFSENVTVRNVVFDVNVVNSDGVDPESSHNVLIENCMFNNHDDNVAIKSGRNKEGREGVDISGTELEGIQSKFIKGNKIYGATENVVVRNCILKGHHAICIGSEVAGSVRNVYALDNIGVQNVKFGLYIKSSPERGGVVEDIYIRNMHLNHAKMGAVLNPCYSKNLVDTTHFPLFRNIYIKNMTINHAYRGGIEVAGWPQLPMENIHLENIEIKHLDKGSELDVRIHNSKNVILKNVKINQIEFNGDYSDESGEKPTGRT